MSLIYLQEIIQHWKHIAPIIHEPQNEDEYEKLACMLEQLLDIVGGNESHELMGLVIVLLSIWKDKRDMWEPLIDTKLKTEGKR